MWWLYQRNSGSLTADGADAVETVLSGFTASVPIALKSSDPDIRPHSTFDGRGQAVPNDIPQFVYVLRPSSFGFKQVHIIEGTPVHPWQIFL